MKPLLVTSALPYANGSIHLGHLVEYIQTDIWVRYWRLRGRDVIYICADDTHGTPIMIRARDEGITPEALIGRFLEEHRRDFDAFNIRFDNYYTTHSPENRTLSEQIYESLCTTGHITERSIEQAYCEIDHMFLPDRYIRGKCPTCGAEDQYGDACESCSKTYSSRDIVEPYCAQCGSQPVWRKSDHIFFRLGDFTSQLREWVREHTSEEVCNKLEEWFRAGLNDWDISRDEPYFGFEIPGYAGKYFYVWVDAPVGYMASTMDYCKRTGRNFDLYWRSDETDVVHFIGKDIVYFHALFWPAMLMGSDFRTPTRLFVHGFLTVNGEKMSKSRGTFINAGTYLAHLDPQYLRYYYATKVNSSFSDLDLNFDDFINRVNSDLVNKIANIPSRVIAILHQHCEGRLGSVDAAGIKMLELIRGESEAIAQNYESRDFAQITRQVADMAATINSYIHENKPWVVAKENPIDAATVCTSAFNAFRIVATYMAPIVPKFAEMVAESCGINELTWSGIFDLIENQPIKPYVRLIERIERGKIDAMITASIQSFEADGTTVAPVLTLDPLIDSEFRTMEVENASPVEGSDKLIQLSLRRGESSIQVLAAFSERLEKTVIKGANLLVLTNLEPRKIFGVESRGMIIAADLEGDVEPVQLDNSSTDSVID